jgi:hypothetical protein
MPGIVLLIDSIEWNQSGPTPLSMTGFVRVSSIARLLPKRFKPAELIIVNNYYIMKTTLKKLLLHPATSPEFKEAALKMLLNNQFRLGYVAGEATFSHG